MILMAKKIIAAVKKAVKKAVVKKKVEKKVEKKEVKIVPATCAACNGRGLESSYTLCKQCHGNGTI